MKRDRCHLLVTLLLLVILGGALYLRLYDVHWDRGYLFHPDERQIIVVVDQLSFPWPPDWLALLSAESPWNPGFFAYGSLPIYLLRICASALGLVNADYATLELSYVVGRVLSALFDTGTVLLVYLLGRKLFTAVIALLGALLVALAVLHIQLAHFYTVDTVLTFWVVLTVLLAVGLARRLTWRRGLAVGVVFGAALATKVSAAPLAFSILVAWFLGILNAWGRAPDGSCPVTRSLSMLDGESGQAQACTHAPSSRANLLRRVVTGALLTGVVALATFVILEPYAVLDAATFAGDIVQEAFMARGLRDVPYTRQFIGRLPYLYPLQQLIVWSLGLPLGLAGCLAVFPMIGRGVRDVWRGHWLLASESWIPLSWVLVYFGLTGGLHAKFLRYMLPVIPFLCLWAAWALVRLVEHGKQLWQKGLAALLAGIVLVGALLYTLSFMHIYRGDHPWVQATRWLCGGLRPGTKILVEHWDDPLPLIQGTGDLRCFRKQLVSDFEAYNPDDTAKLEHLLSSLEANDYIILSSNRLYDTIPRLPQRYPLTTKYYELLMSERLGFELVYLAAAEPELFGVQIASDTFVDPDLPRPKLLAEYEAARRRLHLGRADESFTVYDHPMPLVFKKTRQLSRQELLELLGSAAQNLPAAK